MDFFDILLAKKLEDDRDPKVEGLSVTANGTYSEDGVVYKPVVVNVPETPLSSLAVTANGTYTAPSGTAYNEVDVDVPLPENAYLLEEYSDIPTDIASFTASDAPLKSLTASIVPVQDLHGYDSPWVGGAGKNKFDIDLPHEEVSGSATYSYTVKVKANTDYTMSCNVPQDSPASLYFNGTATSVNGVWNGTPRTFTSDANGNFVVYVRYSTALGGIDLYTAVKNGQYYIQLEEGSTATSYAPYSNICPISGWDEVNVSVCGVNVWDEEWELGGILNTTGQNTTNNSTIRTKNYIPVVPNTQYYINSSKWQFVSGYDADKNFVGTVSYTSSGTGYYINVPSNVHYIRIPFSTAYGTTYNNDISINYPSTDTEYHAYNGQTYTIQFKDGDNPLTVYGGTLDVVSGVLTVDRVGVDLGTLDWNNDSQGLFVTQLPNDSQTYGYNSDLSNLMSDMWAPKVRDAGWAAITDGQYGIATRQLRIKYSSVETTEAFATLVNGSIFVYELATPTTFHTQPTSIKSLDGENNLWASTGEIETLEFFTKETS